jgi:ribose transport system permease protein
LDEGKVKKAMNGLENAMKAKQKGLNIVRVIAKKREAGIVLALIIMSLGITAVAPRFASGQNLYLLSRQISLLAIVAMGEFFAILTAGIDLSVGSLIGVSGVTCGLALGAGVPPLLAILIGLSTGFCAGLLSGWLVSYVGLTPFIPTLGMLSIARGVIWVITKGWPITDIPKSFLFIGRGDVLGIPFPVVIMAVLALAAHIVLRYTVLGRRIFAIGGNEQATFLSGINVKRIKLFVYGISGFFASVTGIIMVARFDSAQAAMGTGWELDAIASAVIGGASLMGGAGSVGGVLIGAAIMGVIQNGLVLMKVSAYWQTLIIGGIIILAATLDRLKNK